MRDRKDLKDLKIASRARARGCWGRLAAQRAELGEGWNRLSYFPPMSDERLAAYLTMPKDRWGHVVSLFYVPERDLPQMEAAWREWCETTPERLWPSWIGPWAQHRKAKP